MDNGRHRALPEDAGEVGPVGYVARDDVGLAPEGVEVGHELGRASRRRAPAAEQQQAAHAMSVGEVASDQPAEVARASGDQDSALGVELCSGGTIGRYASPDQARHVGYAVEHGDVRLVDVE